MTTAPSSNMPLIADKPRSNKIGGYVVFLTLKPLKVMLNISKVKGQDLEFMLLWIIYWHVNSNTECQAQLQE
jgi:hypothetical protein